MCCAWRTQRGLTFQFHTGLQNGTGQPDCQQQSRAAQHLFLQYPEVRFDLFHIGYPYQHVLSALAKNYANVYIDHVLGAHHFARSVCPRHGRVDRQRATEQDQRLWRRL